jgi:hypothetical protein
MIKTFRLSARILNGVTLVSKRTQSSAGASYIPYRDVFVTDSIFNDSEWLKSGPLESAQLLHPTSKHIVASYLGYVHSSSNYHFNNVGEYTVNITAAQYEQEVEGIETENEQYGLNPINGMASENAVTFDQRNKSKEKKHRMVVWPDGVVLENLTTENIPAITKLLLTDKIPDWKTVVAQELKGVSMREKKKDGDITIVLSLSSTFRYAQATKIRTWFENSFKVYNNAKKKVHYYYSNELRSHRNGTRVMILPFEDCFEDVFSAKKVDAIVERLCAESI